MCPDKEGSVSWHRIRYRCRGCASFPSAPSENSSVNSVKLSSKNGHAAVKEVTPMSFSDRCVNGFDSRVNDIYG